MASSAASSSAPQILAPKVPQSRQELRQILADKTVETMRGIAAKNLTGKGIQYPEEYLMRIKAEKGAIPQEYLGFRTYGFANKDFFVRVEKDKIHWRVKPNVNASDAIDAIFNKPSPTLVDCGIACTIALHKALLDTIGTERYNKIFNGRLVLVSDPTVQDDMGLFTRSVRVNQIGHGTLVGFNNLKAYTKRHPFGLWASFNMCSLGNGRYVGLGTPQDGLTEPQIKELLASEFNKPYDPLLGGIVPPQELAKVLQENKISEDQLLRGDDIQIKPENIPVMDPNFIQEFNLDMVEKVLATKSENLSYAGLVAWRKAHPPK